MGVYIFRSLRGPYIKVGHYAGQNAYSRVAHRGFYSCICPDAIRENVSLEDLELVAWFPQLTTKEEREIKKKWKDQRIGEWFPIEYMDSIRQLLSEKDTECHTSCNKEEAMATRRRL